MLSISNQIQSKLKSIMTLIIKFIMKCLNWMQWCKSLKSEKQMIYATFQKNESKNIIAIIDVIEKNSSNNSINEIVFFSCYSKYASMFNFVDFEKLSKRNSYNHVIKIISKIFFHLISFTIYFEQNSMYCENISMKMKNRIELSDWNRQLNRLFCSLRSLMKS